jgi:hypothetical protein
MIRDSYRMELGLLHIPLEGLRAIGEAVVAEGRYGMDM